jgi:hypothetical protein
MATKKSLKAPLKQEHLKSWNLLQEFRDLLDKHPTKSVSSSDDKTTNNKGGPERLLTEEAYLCSFLFAQFNPMLDSMRGLCAASHFEKVQQLVCSRPMSLGSFSEAQNVFGASRLEDIFQHLVVENIQRPNPKVPAHLAQAMRLVDSCVFKALPRMEWAYWRNQGTKQSAVRLHFSYHLLDQKAANAVLSPAKLCERKALEKMLKPGEFYIGDRNYSRDYKLLGRMMELGCSFLFRLCEQAVITVLEELELSEEDRAAGVVSDQIVRLGKTKRYESETVRLIRIEKESLDEPILLITNHLSSEFLSAGLLAEIYRERWAIELFFKWLKCIFGKPNQWHWFAESDDGVGIQMYSALIAALLLSRRLGKLPNKRTMEALRMHQYGMISIAELEGVLKLYSVKNKK